MSAPSRAINEFITKIYSTVVNADQWTNILDQTAQIAGAKAANVCLVDYVAEELNSQFMCSETTRFYPTYMQSPHMQVELKAVARLPQIQTTTEFYETGDFVSKSNDVFTDDPMDLGESEDWLFNEWSVRTRYISRLNIQPSYLDIHTLLFDNIKEVKRLSGVKKIENLTPHFAKAVELSRPFLMLQSRFQATLNVLDRFQLAVYILSSDGHVVLKNSAADRILSLSDAVSISAQGKLKSDKTANSANMQEHIDDLLYKQKNGTIKDSTELLLNRRSQSDPYLVEITPMSEPTVIGPLTGLMVIMIDPEHKKIINTKGMEKMFGLSRAENNVCQMLVEGYSTNDIAETRNVSPITVKNQIKSLLAKTGNRNRSDLIRQALNINLPVDVQEKAF